MSTTQQLAFCKKAIINLNYKTMKTFKITLTGEFNETHEIFVLSSIDLSNYEKHKDRINKIIIKDNDGEGEDLDYYLNYGKFKIEEFKLDETNLIIEIREQKKRR